MPYPVIPTVLGMFFVVVWIFIGGMILHDNQLAARRRREFNDDLTVVRNPSRSGRQRRREAA